MKFKYKLFFSFTSLNIFLVLLLVFIFYRLVASDVIHQQEFQYKRLESVISDTFLTLEKLSEKSALVSLKSIRTQYNDKPLPEDDELKLIASQMGVSLIAATDSEGVSTRDTVTPKPERIKKLFDLCSLYKEMVEKTDKIFVTPIIPSYTNKGPYKFIMISDPSHHGILEVGVKLEFISKLLSYLIKSDKNILSIGFFTPSGKSLGTINSSGAFLENSAPILNVNSLEQSIVDNPNQNYVMQKNIYIEGGNCCECKIKNIIGQDGKYFYLLQIEVSTKDLIARLNKIKAMSLMILFVLIALAIILSNYLSDYLVKRLDRLNSKISEIIDNKNLDVEMDIKGKDEISVIANNFKVMLGLLKQSELEKIHSEKAKILSSITSQVAHDIRSPLVALTTITRLLTEIPEDKRILIRNATQRINDIANELLQMGKNTLASDKTSSGINLKSVEFIPALVDILISEKRMQFREHSSLDIQADFKNSFGSFSEVNSKELKRAISNLINNAIEAFDNFNGIVTVGVQKCDTFAGPRVEIFVTDNGKGIPSHLISQLGQMGVSHGKFSSQDSGNGLGLYHAKQTAESFGGTLEITSTEGKGSTIKFILPLAEAPKWFAQKIGLNGKKYLISLDDDTSIHQLWHERLQTFVGENNIQHIKFQSGEIFEKYVQANRDQLQETLFLIDFELLNQPKTGLDLIEELDLASYGILVTSRYEEKSIQDRASRINLRLLPKALAEFVPF